MGYGEGKKRGFTLVEMIVSSVILCLAVLALGAVGTRVMSQTSLNRQYETAASLADRQLSLIEYVGVDSFLELGRTEGDFEQFEPAYHWRVVTKQQDIENLCLVSVEISWTEHSRFHQVSADTMLSGTGMVATEEQE